MKVHRGFRLSIVVVIGLTVALLAAGAAFAADDAAAGAKLLAARASISPDVTTLTLEFNAEFTYRPAPSGDRLIFVDLPGVLSTQGPESRILESKLVSSYRLVPYVRGDQQGARLEVLLKQPAAVSYQPAEKSLEVKIQAAGKAVSAGEATVSRLARAPVARKPARAHGDAIEDVVFSHDADGARVRVLANGPIEYKSFLLSNPARLVLDIPDATSRASREIPVGQAPLKAIRVGQFRHSPRVARVVIELDSEVPYNVSRTDEGLEVQVRARPDSAQPRLPESKAQAVVAAGQAPLKVSGGGSEQELSAPVYAERKPAEPVLSAALRPEAIPVPAGPSVQTASDVPAVAGADRPPLAPLNVAAAAATPASDQQATPPQQGNPPTPFQPVPPPPPQAIGSAVSPVPAQAGVVQAGPRYTGEPISVNLKDVDLKDFFRLIHEISGLNIVLDPTVGGRVTIVLEDVPWDQALDIVLRNNGLVKQLEGNVLRIATAATAQREEDERVRLATARQESAERVTVLRPLNYQRATQMMPTLAKFRSPKGEIVSDDRTNTLIITDIPQVIPTMDEIIRNLDRRTVQVEIEARVVAASRQFSRDIGAQFGFGTTAAGGKTLFTGNLVGAQNNLSPAIVTSPPLPFNLSGNALPLFSNFPAAGANTGFSILHRSPNAAIDLIISAAETKSIGKLLSRPRIITQNNVQGSVQQGVKIPVQTTVNNTISVQFFDVTLKLQVRPQVTNEGTIFLEVTVSNTTIDPGIARINGVPALDTQEATTQVLVADGGTVVFGGVLQNTNNITIQQTPILGSIPLLGNLFKRTGVNTSTNELLFFLTPRIV